MTRQHKRPNNKRLRPSKQRYQRYQQRYQQQQQNISELKKQRKRQRQRKNEQNIGESEDNAINQPIPWKTIFACGQDTKIDLLHNYQNNCILFNDKKIMMEFWMEYTEGSEENAINLAILWRTIFDCGQDTKIDL